MDLILDLAQSQLTELCRQVKTVALFSSKWRYSVPKAPEQNGVKAN